jgi:hypothetical protein
MAINKMNVISFVLFIIFDLEFGSKIRNFPEGIGCGWRLKKVK